MQKPAQHSVLKGHTDLFPKEGWSGEDNTTVNLQHHNAVEKVNLFLRGTWRGKCECTETARRQEKPHMEYYTQLWYHL